MLDIQNSQQKMHWLVYDFHKCMHYVYGYEINEK